MVADNQALTVQQWQMNASACKAGGPKIFSLKCFTAICVHWKLGFLITVSKFYRIHLWYDNDVLIHFPFQLYQTMGYVSDWFIFFVRPLFPFGIFSYMDALCRPMYYVSRHFAVTLSNLDSNNSEGQLSLSSRAFKHLSCLYWVINTDITGP